MKIGVTGIYASGKGTVCSMFEDLGAEIIDTDILAREIVEPGSPAIESIIREFGRNILNVDGTLNRRALAAVVFKDKDKVKLLNSITHPLINKKISLITGKNNEKIYMINTPLLFETNAHKNMDYNIVVVANTDQVLSRGQIRDNISEPEIIERLNNQISLNEKIKLADYVIDNSKSLINTKRQVLEIWKILQQKKTRE